MSLAAKLAGQHGVPVFEVASCERCQEPVSTCTALSTTDARGAWRACQLEPRQRGSISLTLAVSAPLVAGGALPQPFLGGVDHAPACAGPHQSLCQRQVWAGISLGAQQWGNRGRVWLVAGQLHDQIRLHLVGSGQGGAAARRPAGGCWPSNHAGATSFPSTSCAAWTAPCRQWLLLLRGCLGFCRCGSTQHFAPLHLCRMPFPPANAASVLPAPAHPLPTTTAASSCWPAPPTHPRGCAV